MKTNTPILNILLPTYNCEAYVQESIRSILDQTYTNFELLIIDDASTDRTVPIIKEFNDPRILLIQKRNKHGVYGQPKLRYQDCERCLYRQDGRC